MHDNNCCCNQCWYGQSVDQYDTEVGKVVHRTKITQLDNNIIGYFVFSKPNKPNCLFQENSIDWVFEVNKNHLVGIGI